MAVTAPALSESYYPADQSEPVLDTTVGGILRDAAQAVPDQPALIGGHPDPAERRRWTYGELLDDAERCARAAGTLRAGRAGGGVGAHRPREGGGGVRRGAGGADAGDGETGVQ